MDESPAMKEYWQRAMTLRVGVVKESRSRERQSAVWNIVWKNEHRKELTTFLDPWRCDVRTSFMCDVQEISKSLIQLYLTFMQNLYKQANRGLLWIRCPPVLGSATTTALATLSTSSSSSWSHSMADELHPAQRWTKNRIFDAFLDRRDVEPVIRTRNARPAWVKVPTVRTLALAEEVAENALEGWSGFIRPVDKMWQVSSGFGPRWGRHHNGVDLAAPVGVPVLASDSGEVTFAGWDSGYGNLVEITHRDGWKTLYAHNSEIFTWEGQFVRRGDCIASVGETGRATGPHLHWEIRNQSGKPVDPSNHLKL